LFGHVAIPERVQRKVEFIFSRGVFYIKKVFLFLKLVVEQRRLRLIFFVFFEIESFFEFLDQKILIINFIVKFSVVLKVILKNLDSIS
jgi:hypothetical protein